MQFIARKTEAKDAVMKMIRVLEILLKRMLHRLTSINCITLTWIMTDDGGEHIGKKFLKRVNVWSVVHEGTTPYSLEFSGAAERLN